MLYLVIDYVEINLGLAATHYFCSVGCAEQKGYNEEECMKVPLKKIRDVDEQVYISEASTGLQKSLEENICENCGNKIELE